MADKTELFKQFTFCTIVINCVVLCPMSKTKFIKLISFAIGGNIWSPIFLTANDSIHRKDPQKAKFY